MLIELSIRNFAIIDHLLVRFSPGFTVLTGETGAGKSIIIDALQTALGARVSSDVVQAGARSASVEAIFDAEALDDAVTEILRELGVEDDEVLILRREISPTGRGTARVNGRAVPLSILGALGAALVDIHGQSDHLSVLRRDRQLDILDRYGDLIELRGRVAMAIRDYTGARRRLEELSAGQREMEQRLDLLRFQANEIETANLQPAEDADLRAERNLLVNAEKLTQLSGSAYQELQGETGSAVERVAAAVISLREVAAVDPILTPFAERLESTQYELEDIGQELRQYRDSVEYDPARLDEIEERIDVIMRLQRKYGATIEDVLAFGRQVRAEIDEVENLDAHLAALAADVESAEAEAGKLSAELTNARMAAADRLTGEMGEALRGLGLKATAFEVELTRQVSESGLPFPDGHRYAFTQHGVDTAGFLVSFNPGEPLRPIEKVASGGETSRFLLALKSVLAGADRTPTLIFDEVDVGVGGRNGIVVAERLRALSSRHQVISITHLPQVAALADEHLTVAKVVAGDRTSVGVRALESSDRVTELAEMMSGTGTDAARRNAEELLEAARHSD